MKYWRGFSIFLKHNFHWDNLNLYTWLLLTPLVSLVVEISFWQLDHYVYLCFVLQIYATIKSGSIAIAASTLDSLLDLMAGGILWLTHLSMKNINIYKYPIGKLRVQPVGIVIFAAVMATLGMFYSLTFFKIVKSSSCFQILKIRSLLVFFS